MKHLQALLIGIIAVTIGCVAIATLYYILYIIVDVTQNVIDTFGYFKLFAIVLVLFIIYGFGRHLLDEFTEFQLSRKPTTPNHDCAKRP